MPSKSTVEIADRLSRKRAVGVAAAALVFFIIQVTLRPFTSRSVIPGLPTLDMWAINAIVLLALLATGGGIVNRRDLRRLINDEVSQLHYKSAVILGFWVAMVVAMGLYLVPGFATLTARDAAYLVVTPSVVFALVAFSWLELRAHRDG